jgi:TRAP-type C4-dicarboxylate transport system substrate-binding protein
MVANSGVCLSKTSRLELWIGGYGPEQSAHGRGLATFRDVVEMETDGEIQVRVTWNIMEDGRPNTDLLDLVESGEMFLCYFSSSYLGDRVAALNVLETPFLFRDLDHAHRALDGALGDRLGAEVRSLTGFDVIGFWDNGFRHLTNRKHAVRTPADCVGLTVRVQPNAIHEALIRSWGATPVAAELSDGIRMIKAMEVDAQENPLANTIAYGVDGVHGHVTMTGHLYGARGLWAHRETLESLPEELREVVRRAGAVAIDVQRGEAAARETGYRARMEARGIRFVDLSAHEVDEFRRASFPAVDLARQTSRDELFDLVGA